MTLRRLTFLFAMGCLAPLAPASAAQNTIPTTTAARGHDAFGGIWTIKPGDLPGTADAGDDREDRRRRGGSGFPGGTGGGRRGGGFPGGGGGGGRDGERGGREPGQVAAMTNYVRMLTGASPHLTIVVHESSVTITYDDGARLTLETDNRKVSDRAENGLVKLSRKSRWDGQTLVSEIEIDNGPKLEQKYELSPDGLELRIAMTTKDGGFGGRGGDSRKRVITHTYERPLSDN